MKRYSIEQLYTLDRFARNAEGDLVSGRSKGVSENLKRRLERFAEGEMPDSECGNFIVEIVWNEPAMGYLAELLRD